MNNYKNKESDQEPRRRKRGGTAVKSRKKQKYNIPTTDDDDSNWSYMQTILNILTHMTQTDDLVDTLSAVSEHCKEGTDHIQMIIDAGILRKLIPLLEHQEVSVQSAALHAIGNIAAGTDEQIQALLDHQVLLNINVLLSHPHQKIRSEALWFLSNVAAGNAMQVDIVFQTGVLPKILQSLMYGDFETRINAAWTLSNMIISGNQNHMFKIISERVIPPLCDLLSCKDSRTLNVILFGLNKMLMLAKNEIRHFVNVLEQCGGLNQIEKLQDHVNRNIYILAYKIMDQCEECESEESECDEPSVDEGIIFNIGRFNNKYKF